MTDRIDVDVLVVGAGACGLIAALKAAQAGATVAVVEKLERFAGKHEGIDMVFSNPVRRLLTDGTGAVVGAEVGDGASQYRIDAKKVILATNGYGDNRSLLREFCPEIAESQYFGATGSEGEAIEWGRALGAQLGNVGAYQAHASVAYPHGELLTWSVAEKGAFYVNRQGRRFGNENLGYSGFGALVMAQGNEAYAIYDTRIREYVARYQQTYQVLVDMGGAKDAPTIEDLARVHHIDAGALAGTLARFNRAARNELPDEFGRTEFGMAPLAPPYVITRVNAALFHTQGGLLVDACARVLRPDGTPVPNLFAGGGAAAGVSGRAGGGYVSGNGLLAAAVLGYIAGEAAASEIGVVPTPP